MIISQQSVIIQRLEEMNNNLKNEIAKSQSDFNRKLDNMHRSIKRISIQPVVRPRNATNEEAQARQENNRRGILMKRPKDLFVLWHEYEFGSTDRVKPAKLFTSAERGRNKFAYSRRKVFWDMVCNMISRGYTSDTAIDKIYLTYGHNLSVSNILVKMRNDKGRGGHPDLRA